MSMLDRLRSWFGREAQEARETARELSERMDADLSRREAELAASPEEKLDAIMDEIEASGGAFDEIRAKAEPPPERDDPA